MGDRILRGALIEFQQVFMLPVPNVIVFQFNPETMTHAWTQAETAAGRPGGPKVNPLAAKTMPGESFSFKLELDSNEMITSGSPVAMGIAVATGVYTRLAALEMLQFPQSDSGGGGLLGAVSAGASLAGGAIGGALGGSSGVKRPVPRSQVPVVLFVWGPGRIVPVRVTALSVTETLYDPLLNPIHADAQITLTVLTADELKFVSGPLKEVAKVAYKYSQGLRQALALANLAEAAESIIGMLPI